MPEFKSHGLVAAATEGAASAGISKESGYSEYAEQLRAVPELASFGPVFKTCTPVQLTEEETEYNVIAVHHVLPDHDIFQFHITNTVQEQVLENVFVLMDLADGPDLEEEMSIPLSIAPNEGAGQSYVVLKRNTEGPVIASIPCVLKFRVKEIDPSTGEAEEEGFEDEYQLEDVECSPADYVKATSAESFTESWDEIAAENEVADSYALGERESVQEAVEAVIELMGMSVCDGTDIVAPNARSHAVHLAGTVVGGSDVFVKLNFGMDASHNVAMKMAVRAEDTGVAESVHNIIQQA